MNISFTEQRRMVMEYLYERFGATFEAHGYKVSKANSLYKRKFGNCLSEVKFTHTGKTKSLLIHNNYTHPELEALEIRAHEQMFVDAEMLFALEGKKQWHYPSISFNMELLFPMYGYGFEERYARFPRVNSYEELEEICEKYYQYALSVHFDLAGTFPDVDSIEAFLWKMVALQTKFPEEFYGLLPIGKLKGEAYFAETYAKIIATEQYQNSSETTKERYDDLYQAYKKL